MEIQNLFSRQLSLQGPSESPLGTIARVSQPPAMRNAEGYSQQPLVADSSWASTIQNAFAIISNISSAFGSLRAQDAARGMGLLEGGMSFAGDVQKYYDLFSTLSSVRSFDDLGAIGQSFLMQSVQQELVSAVASQLGIDTGSLSISQLGQAAFDFMSGGGTAAAANVGATATEGVTTEVLGGAGNALGAAGAAYAAYGMVKNWGKSSPQIGAMQGASVGAYVGSVVPGVGTLVGAAVGGLIGGALGCIKGGKHKDQIVRDHLRDALQNAGFLDGDYKFKLADGSLYDMGKDGGSKILNSDGVTERRAYEIDFNNPLAAEAVAMFNPIGHLMSPDNEKVRTDLIGYLVNGAMSNAKSLDDVRANARTIMASLNLDSQKLSSGIAALTQNGIVNREVSAIFNHTIATTYA